MIQAGTTKLSCGMLPSNSGTYQEVAETTPEASSMPRCAPLNPSNRLRPILRRTSGRTEWWMNTPLSVRMATIAILAQTF